MAQPNIEYQIAEVTNAIHDVEDADQNSDEYNEAVDRMISLTRDLMGDIK